MLKLINVKKSFHQGTPNEIQLYKDLNISIEKGEFITIIGSNGSGKSTLLNLIAGTLNIDQGQIRFDDEDISNQAEYWRSRKIARVYQDPLKGTAPSLTILENMSMASNKGRPFGLSKGVQNKSTETFKKLLTRLNLNLEDKMFSKVSTLSGGQRQALSLLMATMVEPKLLLLDEHTAALDPKTSELIIDLTLDLVREKQLTTIMVTHNLKQAIEVGDRLLMFHKGQVIFDIKGQEKSQLTVADLIHKFNSLNLMEAMDDELIFN